MTPNLKKFIIWAKEDILMERHSGFFLGVVFAVVWFLVGLFGACFWTIFVAFWRFRWDARAVGVCALVCLVTCPILLSTNHDVLAETMAVCAYFFLVITVTLQIIELKRHEQK
jgi:hypothetical protein